MLKADGSKRTSKINFELITLSSQDQTQKELSNLETYNIYFGCIDNCLACSPNL